MIPVSNTSTAGLCSSKEGAFLWITQCSLSLAIGSPLSIVSPNTLNRRPRVCSPTGTLIPAPVAVTSISLHSPSLEASMIQRAILFPMCCATSMTQRFPPLSTSSASLIYGSSSLLLNSTSTTGPITCTIFPFVIALITSFSVHSLRR